jgi:hypothetical protein
MTREKWLQTRSEPEIPMELWFSFYQERGGSLEFDEFKKYFSIIIQGRMVTGTDGSMKYVNYETARNKLTEYYDDVYGL